MANWKKVVVSGSSAELSALTLDTSLASGSGGTGLSKSALAAATAGQVLAIKTDLSGFELANAASGDVQAIITPANGGLSISDTSDTNGNVAITMSISDLSSQNTLASADTFAFNDADSADVVTTKKVTLDALSGSIISGIAGDVNVTSGGVSTIQNDAVTALMIADAATGSILSTLSGDVTSTVGGVATITDAGTGSILATISGDVSVDAGGVSTIGSNKVVSGMLATSVGVLATNQFTGSFSGSFSGDGTGLTGVTGEIDIDSLTAGTDVVAADKFVYSDAGTEKSLTFAILSGSVLSNISGDITSTVGGVATIAADSVDGSKLADSITIAQDLTVTRNLSVAGTASFTHSTNLAVADKYILLNSGSKGGDDSGGIVIQGPNNGTGQLFGFESGSAQRWGLDSNFDADTAAGFTPEAFMSAVLPAGTATTQTTISALNTKYNKNGNIYTTDDSNGNEIWIYA